MAYVALVYGGFSGEAKISEKSANEILKAFQSALGEPVLVRIGQLSLKDMNTPLIRMIFHLQHRKVRLNLNLYLILFTVHRVKMENFRVILI